MWAQLQKVSTKPEREAELLDVMRVGIRVKRGELKPVYIGDRPLFSRTELERFVAQATA